MALAALAMTFAACRRDVGPRDAPDAAAPAEPAGSVLCVEQSPDGCLFCDDGREVAPYLEPDEARPVRCNPRDAEDCIEFCTRLAPSCALPWTPGKGCRLDSEAEFRRALFLRDARSAPESALVGKVVDEAGKRIEGALVRVWVAGRGVLTPLVDEVSGKDGSFRVPLRTGPWAYALRVSQPGKTTQLVDRVALERSGTTARTFRLAEELVLRGRVLDADSGEPVADAVVEAMRTPEDAIPVGETRSGPDGAFAVGGLEAGRYHVRVTKFGWRTTANKVVLPAAGARTTIRVPPLSVLRGRVLDGDGVPEPSATVVAVPSGGPGATELPIVVWQSDGDGRFAQDRFSPGLYFVWARRGDMLAYPPERVELFEHRETELDLKLSHRGARVVGRVRPYPGSTLAERRTRVVLVGRSPLAFPRPAAADVDTRGDFALSGLLPGRYEITVRDDARTLAIVEGPRTIEIPIEPDSSVTLDGVIVVRGGLEE